MRGVRTRTRTFVAVLGACLLLAPAADAGKRKVPQGFFGANYSGEIENASLELQKEAWNRLASAGVESARVVFNWDMAQQTPVGPINWYRTDNAVRFATERHIQILPVVLYAPEWAKRYHGHVDSPPAGTKNYTAFLGKLIDRYGPKGDFWKSNPDLPVRPLRIWQIWNEVDLQFQWYRKADHWRPQDAADYGKLLRASYTTIHHKDPKAKVMLSALAIDSWRILGELYKNGNIKGYFDVAAPQVEAGDWHYLPTVLKRFRKVLNRHGAKKVPIWGTEFGWPASKKKDIHPGYDRGYMSGYFTTDKGMASRLRNGYTLLAKSKLRKKLKLQRLMWFTAVSPYRGNFEYDYSGLLRQHGNALSPKPAYSSYVNTARKLEGCSKNTHGRCR
ncbi:MAG: polysaccharide biosynthesis protein PslG [Thermoleophilaceae bacterium]|nr:polysaccharide biosynthesis protein PslG [Thermoleophilaceae bacterium]